MSEKAFINDGVHSSGHKWKVLFTCALANTCFTFVIGGVPATALLLRDDYQISTPVLGMLMGIVGIGIALGEVPWGMLTDRLGDRPILITGLTTTAFVLAVTAILINAVPIVYAPVTLFIGLLIIGLSGGSLNGSSGRAIMQWFEKEERGFAMGVRQTAVPLGYALGAVFFPLISYKSSFVWSLYISALFCIIFAFLTYLWVVDIDQEKGTDTTTPAEKETATHVFKQLAIWRIVIAIGLLCAPQFALMTFTMLFLHDFAHINIEYISAILFFIQISAGFTRISGGYYTDKKNNRLGFLKAVTILSGIAFFILTLLTFFYGEVPSTHLNWVLTTAVLVAGVFILSWQGVGMTELATMAGPKSVATAMAMANTATFFILFATPTIIPWILHATSWTGVWGAMTLVCIGVFFLF